MIKLKKIRRHYDGNYKEKFSINFWYTAKTEETITVTNPNATLTGAEVKVAMTQALSSGAIGENIQANSIVGAKYVIQQVDAVNLNEV